MIRHILAALAAATFLAPSSPVVKPAAKAKSLVILYTSSAGGQIRSCNCTKFRYGGYGRQMTLVKSIRKECPDTLMIEGGDITEWTGFLSGYKSEVASRAMKLIGYQAFVLGENEIGKPDARPLDKLDPKSLPVVAANYVDPDSGKPLFKQWLPLKTTSGLRVGLIGLVSPAAGKNFQDKDFREWVTDPNAALKKLLPGVRARSDLVIVVYHGSVAEAEETAAVKGVDLVLATHRTDRKVVMPEKDANEIDAPVHTKNGVIVIASGTHETWSVGRVDCKLAGSTKISSAKHKLLYLDRAYAEDPEMVGVFQEYNTKVKDAVLNQASEFKQSAEARMASRGLNLVEMRKRLRASKFATDAKCATCHVKIHEDWKKTRHAEAMQTLVKTNQEYDPECVTCHATGVLARNGYSNLRDTPELSNVQCEACHGSGLTHIDFPTLPYGKVEEHTCRSCHTDERSPEFDYAAEWEKVKH